MIDLQTLVNKLGDYEFIMNFIETNSPKIKESYLPSILYTRESIMDTTQYTHEEKMKALALMDSMNEIVSQIFDIPQINLILANIVNEIIERIEKTHFRVVKGELLTILLDNNRDKPTPLTRNYELNEITRTVYDESLNAFIINAGYSPYMKSALENIFSYNLINKLCVDTIDLFDSYLFESI